MRGVIELRDADVGRPLSDLALKIDDPDLIEDARSVLSELQPVEREVSGEEGRIYLRRVQPYRTGDERIGGVVATFTDIIEKGRALRELADRERQARILSKLGRLALETRDLESFFEEVCGSLRQAMDCDFAKLLRLRPAEARFDLIAGSGWNAGIVGDATVERDQKAGRVHAARRTHDPRYRFRKRAAIRPPDPVEGPRRPIRHKHRDKGRERGLGRHRPA